jgi:TorA maturation chaperone TorD
MGTFLVLAFQKEVDAAFLETILEAYPELRNWAEGQGQPDLLEGSRLLAQVVQQASEPDKRPALLEQLAVEFASLFHGVGLNPVDLIESVYLGDEHTLFEAPYFDVVEHYRWWNYEKPQNFTEPEDHIANELDFLAFQIRNAAWALEKGDVDDYQMRITASKDFIQDHLNRWAPEVSSALIKASQNPFYLATAHLTAGLLRLISIDLSKESQGS